MSLRSSLFALGLACFILWVLGVQISAFLLGAGLVCLLAYLPSLALFFKGERPGLSEALVYLVVGWVFWAVLGRLAMALWLPPEWALLVLVPLATLALVRRRSHCLPLFTTFRFPSSDRWSLFVLAAASSFQLLGCAVMGSGPYPRFFFAVDSSFYLMHGQALIAHDVYPPPDLSFFDARMGYHYGTQLMAALVARLSGLQIHTSEFLLLSPVLVVSWLTLAWRVASIFVAQGLPRPFLLLVLLFLRPLPIGMWWGVKDLLGAGYAGSLTRVLGDAEAFGFGFQVLQNLYASFAVMVFLAAIVRPDEIISRYAVAFVLGTLPMFKPTLFLGLGLSLIGLALLEFWKKSTPRMSFLGLVALVIAFPLLVLARGHESGVILAFRPAIHLQGVFFYCCRLALAASPLALLAIVSRSSIAVLRFQLARLGAALLFPVLTSTSLAVLYYNSPGRPPMPTEFNTMQIMQHAPCLVACCLLSSLSSSPRWLGLAIASVSLAPPVASALNNLRVLVYDTRNAHEVVDNLELAEVLARVQAAPGTLLVTNDFHYPANGGLRDDQQFQIPALFGHPCFGTAYVYGQARNVQAVRRKRLQLVLRSKTWSVVADDYARRFGWTHFLVDRHYPHPSEVPLPLLAQNQRFAIYRFRD